MPHKFDIVCIGESLRDIFYIINEATVSCSLNKDHCQLCLEYAEKIPVKEVVKVPAAGNSANAAVSAARLGFKSALISWVGDDPEGQDIRKSLKADGVNTKLLCSCGGQETSEATLLSFQGERTQLLYFKKRKYTLHDFPDAACYYYSAMGHGHEKFDQALIKKLKAKANLFFVFQPGTTHIRSGLKKISPLIALSSLFILNKDEAHILLGNGERTTVNLLDAFHKLGAKQVIITDSKNGADAFDGQKYWHMPIFPGKAIESTGAGDAFAIGVTCAWLNKKNPAEALRWGTANAWSVVQQIGPQAGLLKKADMPKVLKKFNRIQPLEIV